MPQYGAAGVTINSISANLPIPVLIMVPTDPASTGLPFKTIPCALSQDFSGAITGFSVYATWSAAPAAAVINVQIANNDVEAEYVTVNTFTFAGADTTQRFDPAGFSCRFVRCILVSHTGAETLTIGVGK